MNKCLRIEFSGDVPQGFLQKIIQKHARKLELEGTAQVLSGQNKVKIIVCGNKDRIDNFLDLLHKESAKVVLEGMEVEPFLKKKDYRGVFRVIE